MTEFSAKETIIKFLDTLPNDLSVEEIAYRIYFEEKLKRSQRQAREGQDYSEEEAEVYLEKWQ